MFFGVAASAYGQETSDTTYTPNAPPPHITLGFNFSPDYGYRTLANKNGGATGDSIVNSRNSQEIALWGKTMGLLVCFNNPNHFRYEVGLQYAERGYQSKAPVTLTGTGDLNGMNRSVYSYQYIGVPIKVSYFFFGEDLRFFAGLGIATNYFLGKTTYKDFLQHAYAEGTRVKETDGFRKVDFVSSIYCGIDYELSDNVRVRIEPTFRYSPFNLGKNMFTEHLYSLGLNMSFYCKMFQPRYKWDSDYIWRPKYSRDLLDD